VPVSTADGGVIAVADVVEQPLAYFKTHKEGLLMIKEGFLGKRPCRFVVDGKVEYETIATLSEVEEIPADTKNSLVL
jgi:non-ribosomal peptide synthetase component E (peptide arylation enzyme)